MPSVTAKRFQYVLLNTGLTCLTIAVVTVNTLMRTCGLRTSWQKFATLIPKNTRTCLAKQNQAGSYMWVTVKL